VAKTIPGLKTPAVWIPHAILGISSSGILNYDKQGKMGPFAGQLFVGDQGSSNINRIDLEQVKGVYQGVVFPFRSGFSSGILRLCWGTDGSMFVGMTARGWAAKGGGLFGLQQLVWNEVMPFEIKTIKAKPDGFELEFTKPVNRKTATDRSLYNITTFTYMYHQKYGSPIINKSDAPIKNITVSDDGLKVRITADSLKEGYIHQIKASGVQSTDGYLLLHDVGYYTLNKIPDGLSSLKTAATHKKAQHIMPHHMDMSHIAVGKPVNKIISEKHITAQPVLWKNGPDQSISIGTLPGLKFTTEYIVVKARSKIKLTFNNNDDMLHNFVITNPGMGNTVGEMASAMGLDGQALSYIPHSPALLYHTLLMQPKQSETIYFTAPAKPGDYQYICTYPGHYTIMKGVLKIVAPN